MAIFKDDQKNQSTNFLETKNPDANQAEVDKIN